MCVVHVRNISRGSMRWRPFSVSPWAFESSSNNEKKRNNKPLMPVCCWLAPSHSSATISSRAYIIYYTLYNIYIYIFTVDVITISFLYSFLFPFSTSFFFLFCCCVWLIVISFAARTDAPFPLFCSIRFLFSLFFFYFARVLFVAFAACRFP